MKNYEITFITTEDSKDTPIKTVIEKFGGKILKSESLGEKQFAYKIKKQNKGFYTTAIFEMAPEKVAELNKALTLDEEIIRFLLISAERTDFAAPERYHKETALKKPENKLEIEPQKELMVEENLPAKIEEEKPVEKKEKAVQKKEEKEEKVKKEIVKKPAVKEPEEVKKDAEVEEITSQEATEEERLKALDKKLDELLKE